MGFSRSCITALQHAQDPCICVGAFIPVTIHTEWHLPSKTFRKSEHINVPIQQNTNVSLATSYNLFSDMDNTLSYSAGFNSGTSKGVLFTSTYSTDFNVPSLSITSDYGDIYRSNYTTSYLITNVSDYNVQYNVGLHWGMLVTQQLFHTLFIRLLTQFSLLSK